MQVSVTQNTTTGTGMVFILIPRLRLVGRPAWSGFVFCGVSGNVYASRYTWAARPRIIVVTEQQRMR
jgi:hypothetical protein